ncbi:crotonobetainyl-CoA:carnitine CoA-transferase CaiB-like acyl-CoA transferase [Haloactinopolyspora alba]|uniref:Crotonobetainyl-CoA:carnitine CoA-transferase CaiB-like acyl-CoA transferase n=1 Tax=Haloactinopolyspora alba TaxID=648780 RepID=A0A2P8DN39_9ACTN|nr:CoA transferase [Haloactinopolyspora alba]PSK98625.1 crotonobetainyl-CoA:carnitine CoA-transferase CaiB-like acyl-CoA transferase [Haloactinopolyspora alba]
MDEDDTARTGDDAERTGADGPLAGYLVVDLSRALAGPHAGMMLADLGARVIKVEAPGRGDESRGWGPPFVGPDDQPVSTYFMSCNRNKESVTADLKSDDGRELLTRLVARADVLIENFRTGVLDRLGFDVERLHEINPGLVVLSITGFGHDGPEAGRAGYDQIGQGEAGLMSVTGEPGSPSKVGVPIADLLAGMYGASGLLAALLERERTGRGRVVRTSLLASVVGVHAFQGTRWTVAGEVPEPTGNHHAAIAPYGLFHTGDGALQVAVGSEAQWRAFADVVGIDPDDPRFATNADRVGHRDELIAEIEAAMADAPAHRWLARIDAAGIACGKVRTIDEVYEWDQTRSQGLLVDVEHPLLGQVQLPGPPVRFDGGDGRRHSAPPVLGQHDASVRAWLDEP